MVVYADVSYSTATPNTIYADYESTLSNTSGWQKGAEVTWVASGAGNWNTASNWSGNAVPGVADSVFFDDTSVEDCAVDVEVKIGHLVIGPGYTGSITQSEDVRVEGDFTITSGTYNEGTFNLIVVGNSTIGGGSSSATVNVGANNVSGGGWGTTDLTIGVNGTIICTGDNVGEIDSGILFSGNWDSASGTFTPDPDGYSLIVYGGSEDRTIETQDINMGKFMIQTTGSLTMGLT